MEHPIFVSDNVRGITLCLIKILGDELESILCTNHQPHLSIGGVSRSYPDIFSRDIGVRFSIDRPILSHVAANLQTRTQTRCYACLMIRASRNIKFCTDIAIQHHGAIQLLLATSECHDVEQIVAVQ